MARIRIIPNSKQISFRHAAIFATAASASRLSLDKSILKLITKSRQRQKDLSKNIRDSSVGIVAVGDGYVDVDMGGAVAKVNVYTNSTEIIAK